MWGLSQPAVTINCVWPTCLPPHPTPLRNGSDVARIGVIPAS